MKHVKVRVWGERQQRDILEVQAGQCQISGIEAQIEQLYQQIKLMKLTQRQPINITRNRRKESVPTVVSTTSLLPLRTPTCRIDLAHPPSKENQISVCHLSLSRTNQSPSLTRTNSVLRLQKENEPTGRSTDYVSFTKPTCLSQDFRGLQQKNIYLQNDNEQLVRCNEELAAALQNERRQKTLLKERIERLQASITSLCHDFELQAKQTKKAAFYPRQPRLSYQAQGCTMSKQINLSKNDSMCRSRRASLHESFDGSCEEQSSAYTRMKQYKNLYECERLKRINLERQLSICKDNARVEFRSEIDTLNRSIQHLRDTVVRRDNEIREREDLIQRYILKK